LYRFQVIADYCLNFRILDTLHFKTPLGGLGLTYTVFILGSLEIA